MLLKIEKKGLEIVKGLLSKYKEPAEVAEINYELWIMTKEDEYRDISKELYSDIIKTQTHYIFNERLQELESNSPPESMYDPEDTIDFETAQDDIPAELEYLFNSISSNKEELKKKVSGESAIGLPGMVNAPPNVLPNCRPT